VQEQNPRSTFRPGLSIEDFEIIGADCAVGNFTESIGNMWLLGCF
jgi:hypothetical protein